MKTALQDCKRYGERVISAVEKIIPPPQPKKEEKKGTDEKGNKGKEEELIVVDEASGDGRGTANQQKQSKVRTLGHFP